MGSVATQLLRHQAVVAGAGLAALAAPFGALRALGSAGMATYVVEAIAICMAAGVAYLVVLYSLEHTPNHRWAFWLILAGALLFRLQLFPLQPALSDDVLRYRWEGRVQAEGWNPYTIKPDDPRLASLRDERFAAVPGRDIPSIYPPLLELVYHATYRALPESTGTASLVLFKLPFLVADLFLVGLVAGWVRSTGGGNALVALYAWNPLVVVEFAASGHNDALATACVVAACVMILRGRGTVSTLLLAAATLLKWFPAALFPLWLRRMNWPRAPWSWVNAGLALALAAACAWPYRDAWPQILESLAYYESRWQTNNASLYALLKWLSGSHDLAAGVGVGVVAGLALWAAARRLDGVRGAYLLFGAILLLSPNAFPWYFTWIVPLLVFFPNSAWLMLTVLQFLSYHVLLDYNATGTWRFQPLYLWLTYGPFYALLLWQGWREKVEWLKG
jgi:alpha-1,6-mannosyltransferase